MVSCSIAQPTCDRPYADHSGSQIYNVVLTDPEKITIVAITYTSVVGHRVQGVK